MVGASGTKLHVFLSYRREGEEAELAGRIRQMLLADGHSVFIDVGLPIGVDWAKAIARNIADADAFVVLLSEASIAREMVQSEVRAAHRCQRTNGRPRILPIRIKYEGPLDYEMDCYIGRLNYGRWGGPSDDGAIFAHLKGALAGSAVHAEPALASPAGTPPHFETSGPLPRVDPRVLSEAGGTMSLDDPFYVRRRSDDVAAALAPRPGNTVVIRGPRQRGKSSLLVRYLAACREHGKQISLIDFQMFSGVDLETYGDFLKALAVALLDALDLDLPHPSIDGPTEMTSFMQRTLLRTIGGPLVLAFDEVDRVWSRPYKSDFFGLLRSWHNKRADTTPNPGAKRWAGVDLALVLSTEPHLLIEDGYQSPFNVGERLLLDNLTLAECCELAHRCSSGLTRADVEQIHQVLGGHPYLTAVAYHRALRGELPLPLDAMAAADPFGPFGDHLRAMLNKLSRRPDLIGAFQGMIKNRKADPDVVYRLRSIGLVRTDGGKPVPANLLYTNFFRSLQ